MKIKTILIFVYSVAILNILWEDPTYIWAENTFFYRYTSNDKGQSKFREKGKNTHTFNAEKTCVTESMYEIIATGP